MQILHELSGKVLWEGETLISADLYGANLRNADLHNADLYGANLRNADLYGANLRNADLHNADLSSANLCGANLRSANLYGVNLYGANLNVADLSSADLDGANLDGANLDDANLCGANLDGANLRGFQIPQEGSLTVWKKLSYGVLAKLLVPAEARRTASLTGRKCRAEFVQVLEIVGAAQGISRHDNKTVYEAGLTVYPDEYNDDIRVECSNGIHFFLTRDEAEKY